MCTGIVQKRIHECNRYLIATCSILGFLWDGIDPTDAFFVFSLILWIWLPEWDKREAHALDRLAQYKQDTLAIWVKQYYRGQSWVLSQTY